MAEAGGWQTTDAHAAFLTLVGEVAFVLVLAFIADSSPEWGSVIVVALLGLWLLWAIMNVDTIKAWGRTLGMGG